MVSTLATASSASGAALERRDALWRLPAARSVAALVVGLPLIFVQSHAASVGLVAFAVLAGLGGIALLVARGSAPAHSGRWVVLAGLTGIVAAAFAAAFAVTMPTGDVLAITVAAWAAIAAAAEGSGAWKLRGASDPVLRRIGLDWRTVAVATAVAAVVFAVLPRNEVVLVGLVGAYAAIVGVFHGIAAVSARPVKER